MNTIEVRRTEYIEAPNGDIVCTITIPFNQRALLLTSALCRLPLLPNDYAEHVPAIDRRRPETIAERVTALVRDPDAEVVPLELNLGEPEQPPAQTLGVEGVQTDVVMGGDALNGWTHPARRHYASIFLYAPFQEFARAHLNETDEFAAPIPTAIRCIRETIEKCKVTMRPTGEALTSLFDQYDHWCAARGKVPWPN